MKYTNLSLVPSRDTPKAVSLHFTNMEYAVSLVTLSPELYLMRYGDGRVALIRGIFPFYKI